jgi:hypothetical protein
MSTQAAITGSIRLAARRTQRNRARARSIVHLVRDNKQPMNEPTNALCARSLPQLVHVSMDRFHSISYLAS